MKITQLYTYPIKSLRGVRLESSAITSHGFPYDRRFMLLKVDHEKETSLEQPRLETMTISQFNEMSLFTQEIRWGDPGVSSAYGVVEVRYDGVGGVGKGVLEVPLTPDIIDQEIVDVVLHSSPTRTYKMGQKYDTWFSSCFGFDVMLVYLGPHLRPVLGNMSPNAANKSATVSNLWLASITQAIPNLGFSSAKSNDGITFADVAPYLIVTEESLNDVSSRLKDCKMDITKFRPNIVISGSTTEYDEDFWGGLTITNNMRAGERKAKKVEFILTQNCARCKSINVDYSTGKQGSGEAGTALKKLMRDRRVDTGVKYSPIFGRYGFLKPMEGSSKKVSLGDEAIVSKRNEERTVFAWPGLGN